MTTTATTRRPEHLVVAVADPPAITCPPWCVIPKKEHVADLHNLEGFVIHRSLDDGVVSHSCSAYPDGTLDPNEEPLLYVDFPTNDGISLDDAEKLARRMLEAVREARG